MTDTPDTSDTMSWQEQMDRALFGLGFLFAAADNSAYTAEENAELNTHCEAIRAFIARAQCLVSDEQMTVQTVLRQGELLTTLANILKGDPGPDTAHSVHDLPESLAHAMNPDLKAIRHAAAPFDVWWAMIQAQEELGEQPIPDNATVFHFSGSGASTMVTAKQLRAMMAAIYGPASAPEATPCAS